MSATKAQILKAIGDYREKIIAEVEKRCRDYCEDLCWSAINSRKSAPDAHDFTGNLLGSIVVGLYKEREPVVAYYSAEQNIAKAIQVKMSANAKYKKKYTFNPDYTGVPSVFKADVRTDKGWGEDDARQFFQWYRPQGKNLFDIVVAYTTEYADWVEMERETTGILNTYDHAGKVGMVLLRLPRK